MKSSLEQGKFDCGNIANIAYILAYYMANFAKIVSIILLNASNFSQN